MGLQLTSNRPAGAAEIDMDGLSGGELCRDRERRPRVGGPFILDQADLATDPPGTGDDALEHKSAVGACDGVMRGEDIEYISASSLVKASHLERDRSMRKSSLSDAKGAFYPRPGLEMDDSH